MGTLSYPGPILVQSIYFFETAKTDPKLYVTQYLTGHKQIKKHHNVAVLAFGLSHLSISSKNLKLVCGNRLCITIDSAHCCKANVRVCFRL